MTREWLVTQNILPETIKINDAKFTELNDTMRGNYQAFAKQLEPLPRGTVLSDFLRSQR